MKQERTLALDGFNSMGNTTHPFPLAPALSLGERERWVGTSRGDVPARVQRAERQARNQLVPRLHGAGTPQRGVPTSVISNEGEGQGEGERGCRTLPGGMSV